MERATAGLAPTHALTRALALTAAMVGAGSLAGCRDSSQQPAKSDPTGTRPAQTGVDSKSGARPADAKSEAKPTDQDEAGAGSPKPSDEGVHQVIFADRISQGYLLLLPGDPSVAPTRDDLRALVKKTFAGREREEEPALLLKLVDLDSADAIAPDDPTKAARADGKAPPSPDAIVRRSSDLVGLHVELITMRNPGEEPLIAPGMLRDPVLTRFLKPDELSWAASTKKVLLLRAEYRSQNGVRGLRLLQSLVGMVARDQKALIHDPDTGETFGPDAFKDRRLQASLGNVADQVAVVPFMDKRNGKGLWRLATRGMRRFGSPDLEMDGLPKNPAVLQQATHVLYGLAFQMIKLGELDRSGLAVEIEDEVSVHYRDIERAYSTRSTKVPRCSDCPEKVDVHLVNRPSEPQDPREHVVVRIVAPRVKSDAADYDHPAWILTALSRVLGPA